MDSGSGCQMYLGQFDRGRTMILDPLVRLPFGDDVTGPPLNTPTAADSSLRAKEFVRSPVMTRQSRDRSLTGPRPTALILRTVASKTWTVSRSCGRNFPEFGNPSEKSKVLPKEGQSRPGLAASST